ncbi:hypothetical protein P7K49_016666 [Saguinus oedipus]|uniref:Uncharacterized protein n=1 Tax=Saguinus oedipus TaxID=9490 RepID=A0ABQ9VFM6_SAGOE|nr:hypothetical protein P7K49_016666 [Saguinus oedipus]
MNELARTPPIWVAEAEAVAETQKWSLENFFAKRDKKKKERSNCADGWRLAAGRGRGDPAGRWWDRERAAGPGAATKAMTKD